MKTFTGLYILADPAQKRILLENTISNRIVVGKNVELEPYNWLLEAKNGRGVLFGAPQRDSSRTAQTQIGKFVDNITNSDKGDDCCSRPM